MTVPEAAELLGISRESAYKAARAGQLPTVTLGRRLLVPVGRLTAFLNGGGPSAAATELAEVRRD